MGRNKMEESIKTQYKPEIEFLEKYFEKTGTFFCVDNFSEMTFELMDLLIILEDHKEDLAIQLSESFYR